jgi:hypothetical protein
MRSAALWRNDGSDGVGGWLFTEVAAAAGAEFTINGMGLGIGDYDNDGWLDLAFSDIGPAHLLNNNGDGTFTDVSVSSNVSATTAMNGAVVAKTWGTVFFDHDNDGWQDLYIVAGNTGNSPGDSYENFFMTNNADGTFSDASVASGLNDDKRGRSASIADFDGDGFVDVFVGNFGQSPLLYHNKSVQQGNSNNWLNVTVEGTESNRDGIGTRLYLTANGTTNMREISSGPTHGGGDQRVAFFGMGSALIGTLEIHWGNGITETFTVNANQALHYVEPSTAPALTIAISNTMGTDETVLNWGDPAGCDVEVYRSTTPYFALTGGNLVATMTSGEMEYVDTGALATEINYFYAIRKDCSGTLSAKSAEKGVFHFGIVPGTP